MLPREEPRNDRTGRRNWTNQKLNKERKLTGWISGKCVWVECHHVYQSRPCRHVLTKGKMMCGIDHGRYVLRTVGYLPLILKGGGDGFVVLQGYSAAEVKRLTLGSEVLCSREPGSGKPIVVQPTLSQAVCPGISDKWTPELEFDACLFRVWGDAELALYFGIRGVKSRPIYPDSVELDADELEQQTPAKKTERTLNRITAQEQDAGPVTMADVLATLSVPKKNGKH